MKESLIDEDNAEKPKSEPVDRVILKPIERDRIESWLRQLEERFEGMIKFTKSDIANYLIRQHDTTLSENEMRELGSLNYDEMRWISRAIERVRLAKRNGESLSLEDLMAKRRLLEKPKSTTKRVKNLERDSASNNQPGDEIQFSSADLNSQES